MASSQAINWKRNMAKQNSKQNGSQSNELSVLRYSFNRTLKMAKFSFLKDPLALSNPMVNTIGLQGIARKIDSYTNCDAFLTDIDTLVHIYSLAFDNQPAVKEVINSLSELCHRDVNSIRSCFRQFETMKANRRMVMENSTFYGNFARIDIADIAKRPVLRANRDYIRNQPSTSFAAMSLDANIKKKEEQFESLNAIGTRAMSESAKEVMAVISGELDGIMNGHRLLASNQIQSNNNKVDEPSTTAATSDRIPLNENGNGSQSPRSHDELIQKRKAADDKPLENEENFTPTKKAAMNHTNETSN